MATMTAPPIIAIISFRNPRLGVAAPDCRPGDPLVALAPAEPLGVPATPVAGALTTVTPVTVERLPSGSVVVDRTVELS